MKPPIGRMGGKSKIATQLIDMFPPPDEYDTYVEPFVGAGNIFFRKEKYNHKEVINDLDVDVYTVMNGLKKNSNYIDRSFNRSIDKDYFNSIKSKKSAVHVLERLKTSFFQRGRSYSKPRDGQYHYVKTDFKVYGPRLRDTIVMNQSFEKVISMYDSNRTFFYLDPPYESLVQTDYKDYVTPDEVYNSVANIKGYFMLSYNDSRHIRNLFKDYNIRKIKTKYAHTQHIDDRKVSELVITNYILK